jgi:hypothetical protein
MTHNPLASKAPHVLAAAAIVVVLAGVLAVRVAARASALTPSAPALAANIPVPPPATVPAPRPIDLATLAIPCWGCVGGDTWPVRFKIDLDLLAPLGTGTANAAVWFKDFAKPVGARRAEAGAALARRGEGGALPPDDPLLLEAEPWADQSKMRFYPEFFALRGPETELPNLLVPITLARSWTARGRQTSDPTKAMADFQRAIRLGRLLRQDDVTVIQDIVGLACINLGAQGIYDLAVRHGDAKLALVAAVVQGDYSAQRLMTAVHLTKTDLSPYVAKGAAGRVSLNLADAMLAKIAAVATSDPDRRFRCEAIVQLDLVRSFGTAAQQEKVLKALDGLAADTDPIIAADAAWSRDTRPSAEFLKSLIEDPN